MRLIALGMFACGSTLLLMAACGVFRLRRHSCLDQSRLEAYRELEKCWLAHEDAIRGEQ